MELFILSPSYPQVWIKFFLLYFLNLKQDEKAGKKITKYRQQIIYKIGRI